MRKGIDPPHIVALTIVVCAAIAPAFRRGEESLRSQNLSHRQDGGESPGFSRGEDVKIRLRYDRLGG